MTADTLTCLSSFDNPSLLELFGSPDGRAWLGEEGGDGGGECAPQPAGGPGTSTADSRLGLLICWRGCKASEGDSAGSFRWFASLSSCDGFSSMGASCDAFASCCCMLLTGPVSTSGSSVAGRDHAYQSLYSLFICHGRWKFALIAFVPAVLPGARSSAKPSIQTHDEPGSF
jgi:hypothetical protein